jgi:DNA-binding PadR family transcriptional regulator
MATRDLAPGEWALLGLLCERPAHGFALARALERDGEIGRVWAIRRPLVYRALEEVAARGLIEPAGVEEGGRGPARTVLRPTRKGRAAFRRWLGEPVAHVREARSLLLLKLVFAERSGLDVRELLEAQLAALAPVGASLSERSLADDPVERLLAAFRLESALALERFVGRLLEQQ